MVHWIQIKKSVELKCLILRGNCERLTRIKNKIYIQNTQTINISEASDSHKGQSK